MSLFGYTIVKVSYLEGLRRRAVKYQKYVEVRSWFSGWKDLRFIFNYIDNDVNFGGIELARKEYAAARNTNEYGDQL